MTVYKTGEKNVIILLDESDDEKLAEKNGALDIERAKAIVKSAIDSFGMAGDNFKLEVYSRGSCYLLFAHITPNDINPPTVYAFDGFDNLHDALKQIGDKKSSLYFLEGMYYLTLFECDQATDNILSEFTDSKPDSDLFYYIKEHGNLIINEEAIRVIKGK